jgi:HEAT repeat protein
VVYDLRAPDLVERQNQLSFVDEFFARLSDPQTGAILGGINRYETPDEFRRMCEGHLRELTHRLVGSAASAVPTAPPPDLWPGSPFPGLRSFTTIDAPIFFGRGRETDELIERVSRHPFVAVVGASGSEKSSLVAAGLLPRLAAGALPGSRDWVLPEYEPRLRQWTGLHLTPGELGDSPVLAFAHRLAPLVDLPVRDLSNELHATPERVTGHLARLLARHPPGAASMVVVDQLEELFTLVPPREQEPFVALLRAIVESSHARVVVTLRADFYLRCLELPALALLLQQGHVPLSAPTDTLLEMITRPAERAGLEFEPGLPGRILADTGREPGALPLLAYLLDELYRICGASGRLTLDGYERLGGVSGAIGCRARTVFADRLDEAARAAFTRVFAELVDVDEHGHVTRRRTDLTAAARDEPSHRLTQVLTEARLLEQSSGIDGQPVVYVAHEALFTSWDRLQEWITSVQADLRLVSRLRSAARDWDDSGRDDAYLWPQERLNAVAAALDRLAPDLNEVERAFAGPEYLRLLPLFRDPGLEPHRRQVIAERMVELSPASVPVLLECLDDPEPAVREMAAGALARAGRPAVPGLTGRLSAGDPQVRLAAVNALRSIADPDAIPALLDLVHDGDRRVRSLVVGTLEAFGGNAAVRAAASAASGADVDERWRAAGSLGALGASGVPYLLDLLGDASSHVREQARQALGAVGPAALPLLLAALGDTSRTPHAARALAELGPDVVPALLEATADPALRDGVNSAFQLIGGPAVPALLAAARQPAGQHRTVAVTALLAINTPAALFGLVESGLYSSDAVATGPT